VKKKVKKNLVENVFKCCQSHLFEKSIALPVAANIAEEGF
jgi:hypothetical protein